MAALLVVEDDEDARQLMRRWLERDSHDVSVAGDGHRALDLVGRSDYDLVVLDVNLPGRNGYEVARRMTSSAVPRLIMCTVHDREHAPPELVLDSWLVKPFSRAELLAAVAGALRDGNA